MTAAVSLVSDRLDVRSRSRDGLGTCRYWYGACRVAVQHISARSHTFQTKCSMQGDRYGYREGQKWQGTALGLGSGRQGAMASKMQNCRCRSIGKADKHTQRSEPRRPGKSPNRRITLHSQAPVVEFTGQSTASPSQMTGALACVCAHCA